MASFAGTTDVNIRPVQMVPPPGRTRGLGRIFHPLTSVFVDGARIDAGTSGVRTVAGGGGVKPSSTSRAGIRTDGLTFASTWFEIVHLKPRSKLELGSILTQTDTDIEIFNASRNASATLTAITNGASPGVTFPTISPPEVMPPLTSILDPTTTENSSGTGLGSIVQTKLRALTNGLSSFDTSIVFVTTLNDPVLLISGSRIVLLPFLFEAGVEETLEFLTTVIESLDGHEQRIARRKNPRQSFVVDYVLDGIDRQRLQTFLFDWQDKIFGLPLAHEQLLLTSPVSIGATSYPVVGASDVDFRIGGFAAVIQDSVVFDVIEITAKTDTLLTAASGSLNAYSAGTKIMPLRTAYLTAPVRTLREQVNIETFRANFEVTDNDTGALVGDTTPGGWSIYASRVLFDDCNVLEGSTMGTGLQRRVYKIESKFGKTTLSSIWDRNKRLSQKGFVARSRAEILSLRKLFVALRGRQKAFWIPTFIEDLSPAADLQIGVLTMDIVSVGYVRFVKDRLPLTVFRIHFADGAALERIVQSSAVVSASVERLTLDQAWPANRTIAEITRIEWFELVRFDSDSLKLRYPRIGLAKANMPVIRVFDDN